MGARLMAIVAEGVRGRVYLSPTKASRMSPISTAEWKPEGTPQMPLVFANTLRDDKVAETFSLIANSWR
jgi:hypothetical protein